MPVQSASMKLADFSYDLPAELIAQAPLASRSASRLLHVPATCSNYAEYEFAELGHLLKPQDLLVVNNTRVIPARLFGRKQTGGKVEMLLERVLDARTALVQLKASRAPQNGAELIFDPNCKAVVAGREGRFFRLNFGTDIEPILEQHGHVPLPPYISRSDEPMDHDRYQTVFAADSGAVAAPTAGLHFDAELLADLSERGIQQTAITLHVGAGTFLPLDQEQLDSGRLHAERVSVGQDTCDAIARARSRGGRVIAVGTTVVRGLEAAAADANLRAFDGETDIFIQPGYRFRVVDAMITNFHLPESSLLMLVAAFAGRERILNAYQFAVEQRFRFFSYGDAMFLERADG